MKTSKPCDPDKGDITDLVKIAEYWQFQCKKFGIKAKFIIKKPKK